MHTGSFTFVRPSMGAWVVYGLGTENQDLPGFITINPGGLGGAQNFGSAFLPASYQGTPYADPHRETAEHRESGHGFRRSAQTARSDPVAEQGVPAEGHNRSGAGGRHPILRDGVPDAELSAGRARPEGRIGRYAQDVRHRPGGDARFRHAVPAGAAPGGKRRAIHRDLERQVGTITTICASASSNRRDQWINRLQRSSPT